MNAEKAPFFSAKLAIRSLPSVVFFIDGVAVHTLVGFSELGGGDEFETSALAKLMLKHKVCDNLLKVSFYQNDAVALVECLLCYSLSRSKFQVALRSLISTSEETSAVGGALEAFRGPFPWMLIDLLGGPPCLDFEGALSILLPQADNLPS
ncbi:hypothetical protein Esti_001454 [Eimeria stiedai]